MEVLMSHKRLVLLSLLVLLALILVNCFPGGAKPATPHPAGFFSGVWHGWIAPLSLIIGFFNHNIRIYEVHNTGWWYDFGYYIAVIAGFGSIAFFRHQKKRHKK